MSSKQHRYRYIVGLLGFMSVLLGVYAFMAGPKISNVTYNDISSPSTISLEMNTRLDESLAPTISVTPNTEFSYSLNNRALTIRFNEPLLSSTTYEIRITGLTDSRGKSSNLEHSFLTASNAIVYIERREDGDDLLREKQIGAEPSTIYETETLYDFVQGKTTLLVVEASNEKPQIVEASSKRNIEQEPDGTLRGIFGSSFGDLYILSYVREDNRSTETYLYDALENRFQQLFDANGAPIEILEATLAEDGETIFYRDKNDFTLYVDNVFDNQPALPLGVISKINRYFPDNSGIAVERPERNPGLISIINTYSGDVEEVDLGLSTSLSTVAVNRTAYAVRVDFIGESLSSDVIIVSEESSETFYTPNSEVRLHAIDISLNDEFISIESSPKPVIYDNYALNSQPRSSTVTILDTAGVELESFPGSNVQWRFVR